MQRGRTGNPRNRGIAPLGGNENADGLETVGNS